MSFRSKLKKRRARIEIIPLIDVMFLLLCFFVFSASQMVARKGIFVDLSGARTGRVLSAQDEGWTISLNKEGRYFVNGEAVDGAGLLSRLESVRDSGISIVVDADRDVAHGKVIRLLDLIRENGIKAVALAVEKERSTHASGD